MNRNRIPSFKRAALLAGAVVTALGAVVGVGAGTASAASLTLTTVSCTGPYVYGTPFSCTITVTSLNLLSSAKPTGTASLDTLVGRISSNSCTLSPTATTRRSSCTVTPTPLDTVNVTRNPGHGVMCDSALRGRGATCQRTRLG